MSNFSIRPMLGKNLDRRSDKSILLVCFYDPNGISTVWENIRLLQKNSRYSIEILNLWPGRAGFLSIPATVVLEQFLGIMIHSTVCYNPDNLNALDAGLKTKFADYAGIKILMKQDEHYRTGSFAEFVGANRFDVLLTCVPPVEIEKVYPAAIVGDVEIVHTLTGYVSDYMRRIPDKDYETRPYDITYRGSLQPISFGRLGLEKRKIGVDVAAHPLVQGLTTDISSRWEDRISGIEWFEFLCNSKAVLGVESGSNLFDFDGSISERCAAFESEHGELDPWSEAYYDLAYRGILAEHEDNVRYAQISPRHFEAAASRSVQILYEGTYSGIFLPGIHYFSLKRDLSNLGEAIALVRDAERAREMTGRAYRDIISSDAYTYQTFVRDFDRVLDRVIARKMPAVLPSSGRRKVLVLCPHDPISDPRIDWMASSFADACDVCELGIHKTAEDTAGPSWEALSGARFRVRVERATHGAIWQPTSDFQPLFDAPGLSDLAVLNGFARASDDELCEAIGAFDSTEVDFARFRALCRYFVDTNSVLIQAALDLGRSDCVICADLETLPAAVALKQAWGCRIIFDSHEYWPYSYDDFRAWECDFWGRLESRLVAYADERVTVSSTLAQQLTAEYGLVFENIPNATRLATAPSRDMLEQKWLERRSFDELKFLFQGNFAPGRGLESLVTAWAHVDPRAKLYCRGPDNDHKAKIIEIARGNGTLDTTVFFPDAVPEDALIRASLAADVGIIPYSPQTYNNRFSCPNKLSQYMAAGMPIITTEIEYVAGLVRKNDLGFVARFNDHDAFSALVDSFFADPGKIEIIGRRARDYFEACFNWEYVSADLAQRTTAALADAAPATGGGFDFARLVADQTLQPKPAPEPTPEELAAAALPPPRKSFCVRLTEHFQRVIAISLGEQEPDQHSLLQSVAILGWKLVPGRLRRAILRALSDTVPAA